MTDKPEQPHASYPTDAGWALSAAGRETAEAYLKEHTRLARLQADDIVREDAVRHWSLRFAHVSTMLKLAFEMALALIFVALAAVIGGAIWSAAHDNSLVIDTFKVPPLLAQRGLTGDVVAASLLDRLTALQNATDSSRAPSTYASDWGNDIKVDIPNTGISISEAYRYLAGWLGHQTHISGEVIQTDGGIAVHVRVSGRPATELEGREGDLKAMLMRAAERVYLQTQPYRYAVYLSSHNRNVEAERVLRELALSGSREDRPWAYVVWSFMAANKGDNAEALRRADTAVKLEPLLGDAQDNLSFYQSAFGHPEQMLAAARAAIHDFTGPGAHFSDPRGATVQTMELKAAIDEDTGDYAGAVAQYGKILDADEFEASHWVSQRMAAADTALLHDIRGSRRALAGARDSDLLVLCCTGFGWQLRTFDLPQFRQLSGEHDWRGALRDVQAAINAPHAATSKPGGNAIVFPFVTTRVIPMLALAEAENGDGAAARTTIGRTPLDCYACLVARGRIADIDGARSEAESWFARAVALAPSVPFAYSDRGEMLLHKRDLDGAIARFEIANKKGPHFADPLEMWGEALIAKNRSDLALAKFEEAAKYAPNWGRLHLKWGEALLWTGDRAAARKQFAIAAHLDLTPLEKSQLARMEALHG